MNTVYLIAFFFGGSLGSFLNVVIDRVPSGKSLVRPPSHCDACGRTLRPLELVPVFSYVLLKGRCRTCAAKVPPRVLLVELACALGAVVTVYFYGVSGTAAFTYFSGLVLLALAVIDLEQGVVPHEIVLPATVAGLLAAVFFPPLGWKSALLGGGVAFAVFLLPAVLRPGGMGWGDVKLAPFLGIVTGFPGVLVMLFISFVLGGAGAVAVLLAGKGGRKTAMPFVPFLATGTMVALIWGRTLADWYKSLF
ncbi:MAG: prepilin peptidase [Chloroflexi bacterium]|nr:prepilin peptidase [Chloroflexota bacterium]